MKVDAKRGLRFSWLHLGYTIGEGGEFYLDGKQLWQQKLPLASLASPLLFVTQVLLNSIEPKSHPLELGGRFLTSSLSRGLT